MRPLKAVANLARPRGAIKAPFGTGGDAAPLVGMAKKRKKARVPKRIAGVKIPKSLRRAGKPLAELLASKLGREVAADAVLALAIGLAASDNMRDAFKEAGAQAKKSGRGVGEVALSLGRAALMPALAALYESLPSEQRASGARHGEEPLH